MNINTSEAIADLEKSVYAALETYSNVHRGSGHFSMTTTQLFEHAREIVLDYLNLDKKKYLVIFCTPRGAKILTTQLAEDDYYLVSSLDLGLRLGVRALAVKRKALPKGAPVITGGGATRLVSPDSVIWAKAPDKFEPGTPPVINIIAFAKALTLVKKYGTDVFQDLTQEKPITSDIFYHDELEPYSGLELLQKLRQTLVGRNILVPTRYGQRPYINLDNAASTPTFEPVWNVFCKTWHQPVHVQQEIIQDVKSICAKTLGAPLSDYDVVFTSNTTEAINLAAESFTQEFREGSESVLLSTLLEHSSNDLPWRTVKGFSMLRLSVDPEGFIDLKALEKLMSDYNEKNLFGKKRIRLVAISAASNVLGTYNDLEEISRIVHHYGAWMLTDAAQLVAHRSIDMAKLGIDFLAFSAHKVYAPFGCGVLVTKKGLLHFSNEEMEHIRSFGEENAGGIAALGKALLLLQRIGMDVICDEERALTVQALRGMSQIPGLKVHGTKGPESLGFEQKGGVIPFEIKDTMPKTVANELARRGGIGSRYGCHCAHILIKHLLGVGPFIQKLQGVILTIFPKLQLQGLVRVSFGIENSMKDVETLIQVLENIKPKHGKNAGKHSKSNQPEKTILLKAEVKKQMDDFVRKAAERVY